MRLRLLTCPLSGTRTLNDVVFTREHGWDGVRETLPALVVIDQLMTIKIVCACVCECTLRTGADDSNDTGFLHGHSDVNAQFGAHPTVLLQTRELYSVGTWSVSLPRSERIPRMSFRGACSAWILEIHSMPVDALWAKHRPCSIKQPVLISCLVSPVQRCEPATRPLHYRKVAPAVLG